MLPKTLHNEKEDINQQGIVFFKLFKSQIIIQSIGTIKENMTDSVNDAC